jgi:hypothetical protein
MEKIKAFWNLMKEGQEVADPTLWTKRKDFGNKIGLLILTIVGIAKMYGYNFDDYIDQEFALLIGGVVASIWNIVLTRATSKQIGLQPKPKASDETPPTTPTDDVYRG